MVQKKYTDLQLQAELEDFLQEFVTSDCRKEAKKKLFSIANNI